MKTTNVTESEDDPPVTKHAPGEGQEGQPGARDLQQGGQAHLQIYWWNH